MSDFNIITLHITLEAANDPIYEPPTPPEPTANHSACDFCSLCNDPLCFRAGCRNVFTKENKEAMS